MATFSSSAVRHTLDLEQIRLSYLTWGHGPMPLLALHGLGDHALVWDSLGEAIASRCQLVAPDLRGHGDSGKPQRGYRASDIIPDLEALMDHLGWPSAHILGHSWSAKLLTIWATQHPQRFRSMILVDPFFIGRLPRWMGITFPLLYRVLRFLKMMGPFASYEQAQQQAQQLKQYRGWSPLQQAVFAAGIEQKADGRWGSKLAVQARDQVFDDVLQVAGLTVPLDMPTLFVQPDQGLNRRQWQLKPYQTYLQQLQICQVPGNHWPFLVQPTEFNQAIANFLAQQQP